MTVYTDGISFYHLCSESREQEYFSAFYIKLYTEYVNCFYHDKCNFVLPNYLFFGKGTISPKTGFWLTESGTAECFSHESFDKNIYKPIEL